MDGDVILGGLFPVHRKSKYTENACGVIDVQPGFQYLAAMLFALQKINNSTSLLPNITLGAEIYDTCRSQTIGADRAKDIIKHTLLDNKKPLVGVIGPFSSDVSIAVATLLRVFQIPQISYGSSSADLSNKELYENFFRTVPPDSFQAQALVDVIRHFGWSYVYTISSFGNYGRTGMKLFHKVAREADICIAASASLPSLPTRSNYKSALERVTGNSLSGNAHVIVLFTTQTDSAGLLRAAKGSDGKVLTWLGSSGWSNRVDVTSGKEEIANGSLTVGHHEGIVNGFLDFLRNLDRTTTLGNPRHSWFDEVLQSVLECTTPRSAPSNQGCTTNKSLPRDIELAPVRVVVNAVYAMAHALNDMQRNLCLAAQAGICEEMKKGLQAASLIEYLKNVTFPDAAFNSSVKFNENQEIDGSYSIMNFQQGTKGEWTYVNIGSWRFLRKFRKSVERQRGELFINDSLVSWGNAKIRPPQSYCSKPCGLRQKRKPRIVNPQCCWVCDRCKSTEVIVNSTCKACALGHIPDVSFEKCLKLDLTYPKWSEPISCSLAVVAAVGMAVTIGTFVFYAINRNHSVIKAAGRELSLIIFIGILLCFVASFMCLAKPTDLVCTLRRYIGALCFTICYAPLLMKTNRIYRIFAHARHSAARPALIKPMSQVLISMGLIAVQLLITTVWTLSDTPKAIVEYPSLETASLICTVSARSVAVNMVYNLLLMFLCTVFAFKTRSFPRNFNEAKHIGITMYITCSLWIIFLPTFFNTRTSNWKEYMYCSIFILVGSVSLVGLLLPKVAIVVLTNISREAVHCYDEPAQGDTRDEPILDSPRVCNRVPLSLDFSLCQFAAPTESSVS